jgi:uncharacterized protein with PIN domain
MVVDTSAIVATIANEPDASRFQNAMLSAASLVMSGVFGGERLSAQSPNGDSRNVRVATGAKSVL